MAMDTDRPARAASAGRSPLAQNSEEQLARPPHGTAGPSRSAMPSIGLPELPREKLLK